MRRSFEQIRTDVIVAERAGVLALARSNRAGTAAMVRAGRMSADEKAQVDRAVFAFAEKVAIGLHVEGETSGAVRDALRAPVRAMMEG